MRSSLIAPVVALVLPLLTSAYPHAVESVEVLSVRQSDDDGESQTEYDQETTSLTSQGLCRTYYSLAVPQSQGLSTCSGFCGDLVKQAQQAGNVSSVTCVSGGQGIPTYTDPQGNQYSVGKCECNIPVLDEVVLDVVMMLPAIAEIGCELLFDSLDLVLQIGEAAIPGEGEAMDAGMSAAVKAAKTVTENGQDASSFLQWFADPCGSSNYTQMIDKIFDPLSSVSDTVMTGLGCKSKKCPGKKGGDDSEPSAPSAKPSDVPEPSVSGSKPSEAAPSASATATDDVPSQSADSATSASPATTTAPSSSGAASTTGPTSTGSTSTGGSSTITSSASTSSTSSSASSSSSSVSSLSSSLPPFPSFYSNSSTSATSSMTSSTASSTTSSPTSTPSTAPPNCSAVGLSIPTSDAQNIAKSFSSQSGQQLCLTSGLQTMVAGTSGESQVMMNGNGGECVDYSDLAAAVQALIDGCGDGDNVTGQEDVPGADGVNVATSTSESEGGGTRRI